ncbi:hypothetical protein M758_6G080000 [Ceratodon purpureus]|nr:hypothetical protein M758_6G080000 [Ceratodon purpureus]
MASWLTSRLKAAEQLLQQIDQQAAITKEQLEKPNSDLTSLLTPELLRVGRGEKKEQSSSRSETLNLPSQSGNGKGRHSKRSHAPAGSRNNDAGPGPAKEDDFGKRDWTELLGSTDLMPPQSATRSSSSVGSTDFGGAQNVHRGGSQRAFHTAGKVYVSSHETNESTPASKMSLGGAGPSHQSSVQASRTKGPSKYMAEVRASGFHPKADNLQEAENVPRRLDYGAQVLEGTAEHDPNEQLMEVLTHTNVTDIAADPFIQPANQDGEFTELELSVPEGLKDLNLEVSARENIVEDAPNAMLGQTTAPIDEIVGGDAPTLANSDAVALADEKETLKIRMEAGDGYHQESGGQESALDERGNAEETGVLTHAVQTVQETGRHSDDEGSGEDSEGSSLSGSEEQSQSGSGSESDSEYEERVRRRRERRKDLAERRAAREAALEAARAAIRDREELVANLEEEKKNLEKLLAEWEERQVKEAEELNLTMKEVSEAVEVERQRHAVTRREGLAQEAQLEAKNHELAKALAAAERNLEDEVCSLCQISRVHGKFDDLCIRSAMLMLQELQDSKIERETAEEHFAELTARLEQYQNKAKQLEEKIFLARDAHYTPSVMELELESRLNQLTDHLIQKQSQTISNTLRIEKSAAQSRASKRNSKGANAATDWSTYDDDLEYGLSKPYSSKDKNFLMGTDPDTILNQTAGSKLARQLDSVFLMGARVLRTSGSARALAAFYIFLLHSWVLFIFFMHVRSGGSGSTSGQAGVQSGVNELSVLTHSINSTAFNQ